MMLRTNDLSLSQFGGNDSTKEAIRQMIIQQEIIFKNQVRELHRLYWTQKNMMSELYRKEQEAKECSRQFTLSRSQAGSMKEGNVGGLGGNPGNFNDVGYNKPKGFDLGLPASNYVRNIVNNSVGNGVSVGSEMVRAGSRSSTKASIDKGKSLYCYEIIDLEEPEELGSDVEAYRVSADGCKIPITSAHTASSSIVQDMASSSRVQNGLGFLPNLSTLHVGCSKQWEERKAGHSASGGSESVTAVLNLPTASTHKQESSPSKPILFDLNVSQDEEYSQALNGPVLTSSTPSSSSSVAQNELLWGLQVSSCQKEISNAPLLTCTNQKQENELGNKAEGFSSGSNGGLSNSGKGTANSSTGFSGLVEEENGHLTARPDNNMLDKNEEDTVSSHVEGLIPDNLVNGSTENSSSEKDIEGNSDTTQLNNLDVESSEYEAEAAAEAANILANISVDNLIEEDESDQPEDSIDSFEMMTLELPEVSSNEHLIVLPTDETEQGDVTENTVANTSKLRRGRGRAIRDFQKDILPGMVSLARHEICEDMHSIGYKLRKNRSKKGYGGNNWFVPVRSRRSRRYPIRERQ